MCAYDEHGSSSLSSQSSVYSHDECIQLGIVCMHGHAVDHLILLSSKHQFVVCNYYVLTTQSAVRCLECVHLRKL